MSNPQYSAAEPREDSPEALRQALAAAQKRLTYFERFGGLIEQQMQALSEQAATIARETEQEQERQAQQLNELRREAQTLRDECQRRREEITALAGRAQHESDLLLSGARQTSNALLAETVNRLRELGDEIAQVAEREIGSRGLTVSSRSDFSSSSSSPSWSSAPVYTPPSSYAPPAPEPAAPPEPAPNTVSSYSPTTYEPPAPTTYEPAPATYEPAPSTYQPVVEPAEATTAQAAAPTAAEEHEVTAYRPYVEEEVTAAPESDDVIEMVLPTPWVVGAYPAVNDREPPPALVSEPEPTPTATAPIAGAPEESADVVVTRLSVRPALPGDRLANLRSTLQTMPGVRQVEVVQESGDSSQFDVAHAVDSSLLGNLLAIDGLDFRLIGRGEGSLEVEIF